MQRLTPSLFAMLFASACCDCVIDGVRVEIVDGAGALVPVDALRVTCDGGSPTVQACESGAGRCDAFLVATPTEGSLRIEALLGGDSVGNLEVEVVMSPVRPGQCCSGGFKEDRVLTVTLPE